MVKSIVWTAQAKSDLRGIEQTSPCRSSRPWPATPEPGKGTRGSFGISRRPGSVSAPRPIVFSSAIGAASWKSPACWIARMLMYRQGRAQRAPWSSRIRFNRLRHALPFRHQPLFEWPSRFPVAQDQARMRFAGSSRNRPPCLTTGPSAERCPPSCCAFRLLFDKDVSAARR